MRRVCVLHWSQWAHCHKSCGPALPSALVPVLVVDPKRSPARRDVNVRSIHIDNPSIRIPRELHKGRTAHTLDGPEAVAIGSGAPDMADRDPFGDEFAARICDADTMIVFRSSGNGTRCASRKDQCAQHEKRNQPKGLHGVGRYKLPVRRQVQKGKLVEKVKTPLQLYRRGAFCWEGNRSENSNESDFRNRFFQKI